jgi:NAD(P)-dependent dehydrogenase (short-subunit alcohol dehydrogenase family)
MRILITGGAGFVGSHVADALAAAGHDVVVLDALLPQAHGAPPGWVRDHAFVEGDVRVRRPPGAPAAGVDAVCHQAAMVGHGVDPSDAPEYTAHNEVGTAVLLAGMHRAGAVEPEQVGGPREEVEAEQALTGGGVVARQRGVVRRVREQAGHVIVVSPSHGPRSGLRQNRGRNGPGGGGITIADARSTRARRPGPTGDRQRPVSDR